MEEEDINWSPMNHKYKSNGSGSSLSLSPRTGTLAGLAGSPGANRIALSSSYGNNNSNSGNGYGHHLGLSLDRPPPLAPPSPNNSTIGLPSFMIPTQRGPRMSYSSIARTGVDEAQTDRYNMRNDRPSGVVSSQNTNELALLCPFAQQGTCRFGDKCKYLHGLPCPVCQKLVLHPHTPQEHNIHIQDCTRKQALINARNQQATHEDELECVICFDIVKGKLT